MNLNEVCRFCLTKSSSNSRELFFPIDEILQNKFEEVTAMRLRLNSDEFPQKACNSCIADLEQHHYYRNGLIEKQKRLNILLGVVEQHEEDQQHELTERKPSKLSPDSTKNVRIKSEAEINFVEEVEEQQIEQDDEYYEEDQYDEDMLAEEDMIKLNEDEEEIFEETTAVEFEPSEILEDETQHSGEVEEYEYVEQQVEYGELEQVEEEPQVVRRKYNKKPKAENPSHIFECWLADCSHRSGFRSAMKRHLVQAHGLQISNSTCLICRRTFEVYSEYLCHIKSHTRKSQCNICMLTFLDDDKVAAHKRRVHKSETFDQRNFECELCQARFKRQEHLNSHVTYKHSDPSERKFQCTKCPSAFLRISDLKTHEKGHDMVMMQCIYCDYSKRDLKSLRRHTLKVHQSTKLYKCSQCNEEFETHRELKSHSKQCLGPSVIDSSTEIQGY